MCIGIWLWLRADIILNAKLIYIITDVGEILSPKRLVSFSCIGRKKIGKPRISRQNLYLRKYFF